MAPDNDTIIAACGQALAGRAVSLVINLSSTCPRTGPNSGLQRITRHHERGPKRASDQHKRELHSIRQHSTITGSSPPSDTAFRGSRGRAPISPSSRATTSRLTASSHLPTSADDIAEGRASSSSLLEGEAWSSVSVPRGRAPTGSRGHGGEHRSRRRRLPGAAGRAPGAGCATPP